MSSPAPAHRDRGGSPQETLTPAEGTDAGRLIEAASQRGKGPLSPADEAAQARKTEAAARLAEAARRYLGDKSGTVPA
ncbi:MAG: hypothetical protein ACFCUQ_22810, partial [Kiloniellales bacterium]